MILCFLIMAIGSASVINAEFDYDVCDFRMERHEQVHHVEEYASSHVSSQETNLFRNFSNLVLGVNGCTMAENTMLTQKVMMACMESAENGSKEIEIA